MATTAIGYRNEEVLEVTVSASRSRRPDRGREIVEIAAAQFAVKGFEATSLQDIATAAGIRKSSVYAHITSKEELLKVIFNDYIDRMLESARAIVESDVSMTQQLRLLVSSLYSAVERDRNLVTVFIEEMRYLSEDRFAPIREKRDQYEEVILQVLETGIERQEFRNIDPAIITYHLVGMVQWTYRWYDPAGPIKVDQLTDFTMDLLLDGISKRSDDNTLA